MMMNTQVSSLLLTAVGGHSTMSGTLMAPPSCTLSLGGNHDWVEKIGEGGTSGALATTVTRNWLEKLCRVRGLV